MAVGLAAKLVVAVEARSFVIFQAIAIARFALVRASASRTTSSNPAAVKTLAPDAG